MWSNYDFIDLQNSFVHPHIQIQNNLYQRCRAALELDQKCFVRWIFSAKGRRQLNKDNLANAASLLGP